MFQAVYSCSMHKPTVRKKVTRSKDATGCKTTAAIISCSYLEPRRKAYSTKDYHLKQNMPPRTIAKLPSTSLDGGSTPPAPPTSRWPHAAHVAFLLASDPSKKIPRYRCPAPGCPDSAAPAGSTPRPQRRPPRPALCSVPGHARPNRSKKNCDWQRFRTEAGGPPSSTTAGVLSRPQDGKARGQALSGSILSRGLCLFGTRTILPTKQRGLVAPWPSPSSPPSEEASGRS